MYKILSYLLLGLGILLIFFSLHSMYQVFAEGREVASLVQMEPLHINTQAGEINIPVATISTLANLGLFTLFMVVVAAIGGKVAGLGCQILKNERIHDALTLLDKVPATEVLKKL